MSPPRQPVAGAARGRMILLTAALAAVLAGVLFLAIRPRQAPFQPPPEVHRENLELRNGSWHAPGETNAFTGILFDTYGDGAMKSRSAVSNGLLQGLSQGWWTNGQLQVTEYYSNGVSHGERTKYHPDGGKLSVATIVDGELEGRFERWHENGILAERVHLRGGVPDGESLAYHPDGSLKARVRLEHGKVVEQQFWEPGQAPPGP